MRVVHITPTYFDVSSTIGGGERYVTDLALWMSKKVFTTLVTFSLKRSSYFYNDLKVEVYPVRFFIRNHKVNPLQFRYLRNIFNADIVHVHFLNTLVSDLSCLLAAFLKKPVFVTDYGSGSYRALNQILPLFKCYHRAIAYSEFGIKQLPEILRKKVSLIKGGIDTTKFRPSSSVPKQNKILFVGRVLPHKGINYLIEAFRILNNPDYRLVVVGMVHDNRFYNDLRKAAHSLKIEFVHDADDARLIHEYRTAKVTVLPSVYTTVYGDYLPAPELMGLALLESQACGTPVIASDVGGLPEYVVSEQTGFVVKKNSAEGIACGLRKIIQMSETKYRQSQIRCRNWVEQFNWAEVVMEHIKLYSGENGRPADSL